MQVSRGVAPPGGFRLPAGPARECRPPSHLPAPLAPGQALLRRDRAAALPTHDGCAQLKPSSWTKASCLLSTGRAQPGQRGPGAVSTWPHGRTCLLICSLSPDLKGASCTELTHCPRSCLPLAQAPRQAQGAVTSAGVRVQRRREPNVPCGYEAWTPCNHVSRAWASQSHEFPAGEGLGLVTPESRRQHLLQGTPARRRAGPASETLPCGDPCAPRLLPMPMVLLEAAPPRPQAAVSLGRPLPLARSRTCPQCPVGLLSEGRCLARCRPSPRGGPPSCWQPLTCTCHSTS